jgi:hypothetical protein
MRPRTSKLRYLSIASALLVTAPLSAQDEPNAPATPPAEAPAPEEAAVVREQTVYVPYDDIQKVFEAEGRGIFLPYEEFLKLWHKAHPTPPPPPVVPPPADAVVRGGSYTGSVRGEVARFDVVYEVEALKDGWSELALPLRGVAVESVDLEAAAVAAVGVKEPSKQPSKQPSAALFAARGDGYALFLPHKGQYRAKLSFSARVASAPGRKTLSFGIPQVAVSRLDLTVPEKDLRFDVKPLVAAAAPQAKDSGTQLLAFLGNASEVSVSWMPPVGRAGEDAAVLFAEAYVRASLGERILRLGARIDYQVVRGEVGAFRVRVPVENNTRLISVKGTDIREWSQKDDLLSVELHSPLKDSYQLSLAFERILEETPRSVAIALPRIDGVLRESGWLALTHDPNLKVRVTSARGLSQLDPQEVPEDLRQDLRAGFRYLAPPEALELAVEPIVPQVKSSTTSVVVLGRERDVWVGFVDYQIARAGVFRLDLRVPSRWSVEEIGGTDTVEDHPSGEVADGLRRITVNLKSRQLGGFRLPFRLAAEGSAAQAEATLSPPYVAGSEQDRGVFGVSGPRSLELTTLERSRMTSADVQELFRAGVMGLVSSEADTPLAYSYAKHETGAPATVKLAVKPKQQTINVLVQQLVETTSDDRILVTYYLDYEVLYKEAESLEFTAPSSLDGKLKVESKDVKESPAPSALAPGVSLYRVALQSPTTGSVSLTATHELSPPPLEAGVPKEVSIPLLRPHGTLNAVRGYIALRKAGKLDVRSRPSGLEVVEAANLPDKLRRGQVFEALREIAPEPKLALELTKYDYRSLASTAVDLVHLKCVLSENPRKLETLATFFVQSSNPRLLEVALPEPHKLLGVFVNGKEEVSRKRKDGANHLISLPASAPGGAPLSVVLFYEQPMGQSMGVFGSVEIQSPAVVEGKNPDGETNPIPVEKVALDLYVPRDYVYVSWSGRLRRPAVVPPSFTARLGQVLGSLPAPHPAQVAARLEPTPTPSALLPKLPVEGLQLYTFECRAREGSLRATYSRPALFYFIEVLFYLAALIGGLVMVRVYALSRRWVLLGLTAAPLTIAWFLQSAWVGLFAAAFWGGVSAALVFGVLWCRERLRAWRAARLALAPDPFLEEAPAAPPSSLSGVSSGTSPASQSSPPEPAAAAAEPPAPSTSAGAPPTEPESEDKPPAGKRKSRRPSRRED